MSYSISELHSTYINNNKIKLNFIDLIKKLIKNLLTLLEYESIFQSNKKKDVLIISNITNGNTHEDNYFGNLQNILKKKVNCLTVYRNLSDKKNSFF